MKKCDAQVEREIGTEFMPHFNVDSAARDIEWAASAINASAPQYIYGESYGTDVTQRLLEIFPKRVTAAIFDGFSPQVCLAHASVSLCYVSLVTLCHTQAPCRPLPKIHNATMK